MIHCYWRGSNDSNYVEWIHPSVFFPFLLQEWSRHSEKWWMFVANLVHQLSNIFLGDITQKGYDKKRQLLIGPYLQKQKDGTIFIRFACLLLFQFVLPSVCPHSCSFNHWIGLYQILRDDSGRPGDSSVLISSRNTLLVWLQVHWLYCSSA